VLVYSVVKTDARDRSEARPGRESPEHPWDGA
jgi:hypothetical protein